VSKATKTSLHGQCALYELRGWIREGEQMSLKMEPKDSHRGWRVEADCFKHEWQRPEKLGYQRWTVEYGWQSVMKTRWNEVVNEHALSQCGGMYYYCCVIFVNSTVTDLMCSGRNRQTWWQARHETW